MACDVLWETVGAGGADLVKRRVLWAAGIIVGVLCLPLTISASSDSAPQIPTFTIHNFLPEFWQFWDAAHDQPVDKQMQLWRDLYVKPHQPVFDDLAENCKPEFDPRWAESSYFPALPKLVSGMRVISDDLKQQLGPANERFLKAFPDMHWAGDIYIMASGYCFRGRAQTVQGRSSILFGVDTIVSLQQEDLIPGIHHELFHRYHHQFFDYEPSSGYPQWTSLWEEGMAVYVSEQLNPSASERDLSMVPLGMVDQVNRRQAELAADFLKRFDSTSEKDATVYFNDTNSKDPFVPARAGYELGVLVARRLAEHSTLQQMAHWSQQEAKPRVRQALVEIANSASK
jgi:hypothetical protein